MKKCLVREYLEDLFDNSDNVSDVNNEESDEDYDEEYEGEYEEAELEDEEYDEDQANYKSVRADIISFFSDNPNPDDEEVHEFAEYLQLDKDELENHIYSILGAFLGAGKSKEYDGDYDPEELAMGIEVEMEHTTCPMLAERIAKDHLAEIPDYYTRLKEMEEEAGIED